MEKRKKNHRHLKRSLLMVTSMIELSLITLRILSIKKEHFRVLKVIQQLTQI